MFIFAKIEKKEFSPNSKTLLRENYLLYPGPDSNLSVYSLDKSLTLVLKVALCH